MHPFGRFVERQGRLSSMQVSISVAERQPVPPGQPGQGGKK
jgi:hypothetical protein